MSGDLNFNSDAPTTILEAKAPRIFLMNGPPSSGKDTGAMFLQKTYAGKLLKFAEPLKKAVTAIYHGGNRAEFDKFDSPEFKDLPQEIYFGKTCRQVQIGVSENFLKPFHDDKAVFGKLLYQEIERQRPMNGHGPYFISDSGFREEAEYLIQKYSAANVFLLKTFREGHTFKGDSRNYITLDDLGVREFDIDNITDNLSAYYRQLTTIVDCCLNPSKV